MRLFRFGGFRVPILLVPLVRGIWAEVATFEPCAAAQACREPKAARHLFQAESPWQFTYADHLCKAQRSREESILSQPRGLCALWADSFAPGLMLNLGTGDSLLRS